MTTRINLIRGATVLAIVCILLNATATYAAPSVNGLTITWPDDGYYQVQLQSDYSNVCEGTRECVVQPGIYTVINHTTQQRFANINVQIPDTNNERGFQIVGNTFLFADSFWFQVQNSQTYESLCNGLTECEVETGTYTVINHTLSQRFENIAVGTPSGPTAPTDTSNSPVVNGNIISWAGDGWYQVQDSVSFASICEGGTECQVADGSYRVINLSTGARYDNIIVGGGDTVEPANPDPTNSGPTHIDAYPASVTLANANLNTADFPNTMVLPSEAQAAGDINGDGLIDIIVILEGEQTYQRSAAILFADRMGNYPDLPLNPALNINTGSTLTHGFLIDDVSANINGIGDINGDGFDDLSFQSSGFFALAERVVMAGGASFPARISTADLSNANLLVQFPISGSVVTAGDINGDGIDDLYITGPSDVATGLIYGAEDLNSVFESREELREQAIFDGCSSNFCVSQPIGDFDNDGYDDVFISRFGAGICGYASFTSIVYGGPNGIEVLENNTGSPAYTEYPANQMTRIIGEQGGDCYPRSLVSVSALGDVDGDGATDLVLEDNLIFGMGDQRREFVSINELDGQRGFSIPTVVEIEDVNNDGYDDIVFENGLAYAGFTRNIVSIDSPIVQRTPESFIINVADNMRRAGNGLSISINNVAAGDYDALMVDIEIDDFTGGSEAVVVVEAITGTDETVQPVRRTVPAFPNSENLVASLQAPRIVELTFNGDSLIRRLSHYLVWRDGAPIGRSINGADNYIDVDVELGTSYSYYITPDYLPDDSLDASTMRSFPLLQRRSNTVTITTPDN